DVGQRLRGSHGDRVAGVHAHRVEVLDRADDHAVVGPVAHDLELVLLPTGDRALDEDLRDRAGGQARDRDLAQLLDRVGPAGTSASGRSRSMIAVRISGVSGSTYVRSAKSGSVMIVAGFELARMTR